MKICIAGKNNIAVDVLLHTIEIFPKSDIYVVLNRTENFKNTWQKSLGFYAQMLDISICALDEVKQYEDLVFISLEFDRIINPTSFKTSKLYNLHFSYLPEFKGMYTSLLPILHGKKYTGVTLHKIDAGIDTGDIITQKKFIIENLTCGELYATYLSEGTKLVLDNFDNIIHGKYQLKKQPYLDSTYFSKKSFDFSNKEIDCYQTGNQIKQFVNALYFRQYQLATFQGFKIYKAEIVESPSMVKVATIIEETIDSFLIQAIDCCVKLYKDYYDNLIDAIEKENIDDIKLYSQLVSSINEIDVFGWNPMMRACYSGNLEAVIYIQENGGNLSSKNLNGTTTLMYAKSGYEKTKDLRLINYILESGISPKINDIRGKTIVDYTTDIDLIRLFEQYD